MKVLLLAGEESGMIYAERIREGLAGCEVRGYGDYGFKTHDLAVMGFWEVLKRIRYFLRVKKTMEKAVDEWRPDVVCTVDYPGMNLKICRYAKSKGIRTVHVVCPQVWAWKSGRIPRIEESVDRLCCFLPFEPSLFTPGVAEFVGHPLVEEFSGAPPPAPALPEPPFKIALLPGSRIGEIRKNLPAMLEAVSMLRDVSATVPAANPAALKTIEAITGANRHNVEIVCGGARKVLSSSSAAVVASGTATLEAALCGCPTVLVYKVSPLLAWFARRVIKGVRHIGLVNIIWEKTGEEGVQPMKELLQGDFTAKAVADEVDALLRDGAHRAGTLAALRLAISRLKTSGSPMRRITQTVLDAQSGRQRMPDGEGE